jgi:hypothetical protein
MTRPLERLARSLRARPHRHAVLVGAGMSRSAGIATGDELIRALARRHGADAGAAPVRWYLETFGHWPSYEALLCAASGIDPRAGAAGFFVGTARDDAAGVKVPQRAHRALAALAAASRVRLVLTTNFDRLIEQALAEAGVPVRVASTPSAMGRAMPPAAGAVTLVKLHGDCADLRPKVLARPQTAYADHAITALLTYVFDRYDVIVCGWSAAWDVALRRALAAGSRWREVYWAAVGEPTPEAAAVIAERGAHLVPVPDADTFFADLAARVLGTHPFGVVSPTRPGTGAGASPPARVADATAAATPSPRPR